MNLNISGKTTLVTDSTKSEGSEKFISNLAQKRDLSEEGVEREFFEKIKPTCLLKRFAAIAVVATFLAYIVSSLAVANNSAALRLMSVLYPQYSDSILN